MTKYLPVRLLMIWAVLLVVSLLFSALPATAQGGDACLSAFLAEAERLGAACAGLEPGMLCPGPTGVRLQEAATGSVAPATGPVSLAGSAAVELTAAAEEPGLAVMQLPALEEGRSLSAVLWGAVRLLDAPAPPRAPVCEARSLGSINVRSEPSTQAAILGQLTLDQVVPITARLPDATWWRIEWNGDFAWVFAELTPSDCDPAIMLVYDPGTGAISGGLPTPAFQAVQLETGLADLFCPAALQGGALLQSPAGGASWLLNGLRLHLDGTLWIQAPPHDVLAVQVLEGQVVVDTGQVSRVAGAGQMLRVPLRAGAVDGVPGPALDGLAAGAAYLPVTALPRPVDLPTDSASLPANSHEAVQCSVMPQQIQVIPDDEGVAALDLVLEIAQTVRVSASGGGLTQLAVGDVQADSADADANFQIVSGARLEAGTYRIMVSAAGGEPVTLGVTCDLPAVSAADITLSCDDLLLRWDAVQGGGVQFNAPAAARASVIVTHPLPSEGPAGTLAITDGAGGVLGQVSFAGVSGMQVAGPLVFAVPATGTYRVEWDGDPFNSAAVEVVCEPPPPAAPAEE